MLGPYLSFLLTKFQSAILAILFKVRPSQPEKTPKIAFLNFVNKKLRFGSGIIGWVFVCVFCKQNAKMTKFVRKIVIFEFCKQNTLTVTLCMMPEPYLSFLQTEFKNVILAIFAWAPEVWCPPKLTNRFFVLISRMGFGTLIFCCLPIVFMCSTQNLVLSEHGQHEWACSDEKTLKK